MPAVLSFSHAAQVLYKLSVLDYPGWDRSVVRTTADVLLYFDQAASQLDQEAEEFQRETGCLASHLIVASEKMRDMIKPWKEALENATTATTTRVDATGPDADHVTGFEPMDTAWLSLPDDVWFSNFFIQ